MLYLPGGLASLRWAFAGGADGARADGARARRTASPLLDAHEVTVRFGGLTAVDAVERHASAGELVGIIGPNGAGKTTFFNAISGVQAPTSGQLVGDGRAT